MEKKWIVPVVTGILSLSLVGCGRTEMKPMSPIDSYVDDSINQMQATLDASRNNEVYNARAGYSGGEKMLDGARYYADGEGAVDKDGRDTTQQGCKNCPQENRVMSDVERAMRDVGRTMDSVKSDM